MNWTLIAVFHTSAFLLGTVISTISCLSTAPWTLEQWAFLSTAVYFVIAFATDLPGDGSSSDVFLNELRNTIFSVAAFPLSAILLARHFYGQHDNVPAQQASPFFTFEYLQQSRWEWLLIVMVAESFFMYHGRRSLYHDAIYIACISFGLTLFEGCKYDDENANLVWLQKFSYWNAYLLAGWLLQSVMTNVIWSEDVPAAVADNAAVPAGTPSRPAAAPVPMPSLSDDENDTEISFKPRTTTPPTASVKKAPSAKKTPASAAKPVASSPAVAPAASGTSSAKSSPQAASSDTTSAKTSPKASRRPAVPKRTKASATEYKYFTDEDDNAVALEQAQLPRDLQAYGLPGAKSPMRGLPTTRLRSRRSILP